MTPSNTSWLKKASISTISLWLIIFALIPTLLVIATSFLQVGENNFVVFSFTINNYQKILDPLFFHVFFASCYLAFITTFTCLLVGYPFAYLLTQFSPKWRRILLLLVIIPFWTSSLIRIYAIKILLLQIERALRVFYPDVSILYTEFAVLIGLIYTMLPFMILPLFSTMEKLDRRLIEAAQDLGATPLQTFTRVVLPLTIPGIIAGSMLVFLPVLGLFYVTDLLGGAKNIVIGNLIKNQFLVARNWPFASAASVFVIILMAILIFVYVKSVNKFGGGRYEKI